MKIDLDKDDTEIVEDKNKSQTNSGVFEVITDISESFCDILSTVLSD